MLNYEYTTYYTFNEYTSWLDSPSSYPPTASIRPNVPTLMLLYVSTAYLPPLSFMPLVDGSETTSGPRHADAARP